MGDSRGGPSRNHSEADYNVTDGPPIKRIDDWDPPESVIQG